MTEKLDQHAPTIERVLGTKRQLQRAGIPDRDIDLISSWIPAILAAEEKWRITTDEGLTYLMRMLEAKIQFGESDKDYTLVDNVRQTQHSLKNKQVVFYEGVLVQGRPVAIVDPRVKNFIPPLELDISEKAKSQCDGCGIVAHCLKEVVEPFSEKIEHLCNFCLTHHEHPRINALGGSGTCEECSVRTCQQHPEHRRNVAERPLLTASL